MRKVLLLIMMLMPIVVGAKEYELYCSIDNVSTGGPFFENDSVRFDFKWRSYSPYFIEVKIKNKTDSRITIEWENARIGRKQICFGTDNLFSFNNPKSDEVIQANFTTKKEVGERESPEYRFPLFLEDNVKKYGSSVISVILPVKFHSGQIVDYKIYVSLKYK